MIGKLSGLAAAALLAIPAGAQIESIRWEEAEMVYPGVAFSYLLPHVAACVENALEFHSELYRYTPDERIKFFLEDFSDYGHGGANTVPTNFVNLGVAPFNYVYDTVPAVDRMFWMSNHEMAHIVTMDQAADRDLRWRESFAGKVAPVAENPLSIYYNYLTNPRWNAPRWYHEGIAVFLETWMAGGLGRAQGAYDEMVFRTMTRDGQHFYDIVGLESEGTAIDFQVGVNSYLYGTRFMTYMANREGPEKLIEWTRRAPGSKAHFSAQFEHVYGAPLGEEWRRWIEAEKQFQQANLETIRQNPVTAGRPITALPVGSASRAFPDSQRGVFYVAVRAPGEFAHIAEVDFATGQARKLGEVDGPAIFYVTSLAFDPEGRQLFYSTDNYGWRDLMVYDLERGRRSRLMKDQRIGDLVFNRADRSLWGVRHYNGISTLVRMPAPWTSWEQIHSWPYGSDLYDIDLSSDGHFLSGALAEIDGTQRLVRFDVSAFLNGPGVPDESRDRQLAVEEELFDFEQSSPSNFVFSEDGRYLYGSSYYNGVSNVYRYDLDEMDIDILTNAETGFFRPTPLPDGRLMAFEFTSRGLLPVEIANEPREHVAAIRFLGTELADNHPIVRQWKAPSPRDLTTAQDAEKGKYSSLKRLRLDSVYPIVEGYRDSWAGGVRLDFSDGFDLSGLGVSLSLSPDKTLPENERWHALATLHHWNWLLEASYNRADFYDLFGPTKTSRKGYSLGFEWSKNLLYDEPTTLTLRTALTGWGGLDTLPDYQNIPTTAEELVRPSVRLEYRDLRRSLGAVDDERGILWNLDATANWVRNDFVPRLYFDIDGGVPLPIRHSSLWIRTSTGYGFGDRDDEFARFFFGGFRNNYVDYRTANRYRLNYTFPGIPIDAAGGRSYTRAQLEWNLPPVRFRSLGWSSFYFNWLRPALFSTLLGTDLESDGFRQTLANVGLQMDFKLVMFSNLSAMLSVGYAFALDLDDTTRTSDEILLSLKIL